MTNYLANHLDLNAGAIAAFALVAFILVACSPAWTKRRRRARVLADRHARVDEDRAWAHRHDDAEVALRLRWERHVAAMDMGGHSVAVEAREEFALGLGGIDGGGS